VIRFGQNQNLASPKSFDLLGYIDKGHAIYSLWRGCRKPV